MDPPYEGSRHYRADVGSYLQLGRWSRGRRGQVIVCEQKGATWLPFVHFRRAKSINRGTNTEVVWLGPTSSIETRRNG